MGRQSMQGLQGTHMELDLILPTGPSVHPLQEFPGTAPAAQCANINMGEEAQGSQLVPIHKLPGVTP